jgi:hypothetical protein
VMSIQVVLARLCFCALVLERVTLKLVNCDFKASQVGYEGLGFN